MVSTPIAIQINKITVSRTITKLNKLMRVTRSLLVRKCAY